MVLFVFPCEKKKKKKKKIAYPQQVRSSNIRHRGDKDIVHPVILFATSCIDSACLNHNRKNADLITTMCFCEHSRNYYEPRQSVQSIHEVFHRWQDIYKPFV